MCAKFIPLNEGLEERRMGYFGDGVIIVIRDLVVLMVPLTNDARNRNKMDTVLSMVTLA